MSVYYNDNDPYVAQWLRNLIKAGHLPDGEVDERSIVEVQPGDVAAFTHCHFFAGIGGWALAMRLAQWPDERPLWTGSCPCQPFSAAGLRLGSQDDRHLWPQFLRLIAECRPASVAGEQVTSKLGRTWLSGVRADLEGVVYAVGAADLSAAGVGAPHIRQRLWWVADARSAGSGRNGGAVLSAQGESGGERRGAGNFLDELVAGRADGGLAFPSQQGFARRNGGQQNGTDRHELADGKRLGFSCSCGCETQCVCRSREADEGRQGRTIARSSFWSDAEWLPCTDGKSRPVEPSTFPLAHGVPARVGRLRAYGNAINPYCASEVLKAWLVCSP